MRRLDRTICPAPACLEAYHHDTHSWSDVRPEHKAEIRAHLERMQGRRCAYCEGDIDVLGQHVEHFRRKGDPANRCLTFDWGNLFWSCDQSDSCGHFKDHGAGAYNVADLINPCSDEPDGFFIFRSDGTISVRRGLSADDERRARETLRVFSLSRRVGSTPQHAKDGRDGLCQRGRRSSQTRVVNRRNTSVFRSRAYARAAATILHGNPTRADRKTIAMAASVKALRSLLKLRCLWMRSTRPPHERSRFGTATRARCICGGRGGL